MTQASGTSKTQFPDFIVKLLTAARKEAFRQFTLTLDAVEPRLIGLAQDAESAYERDRYLLTADKFSSGRQVMIDAYTAQWDAFEQDFRQPEDEHNEQLKTSGFSMVGDDDLKEGIKIQKLIAKSSYALKFVMVPISSGFAQSLPNTAVNESTIPFFPRCIGQCIQYSLSQAKFSTYLDDLLRELFQYIFFPSLKHLYLGIRKQLESYGFKLEEEQTRHRTDERWAHSTAPSEGSQLIEVPKGFNLNMLDLLKAASVPANLSSFTENRQVGGRSLSVAPADISNNKAIVTISNKDIDAMLARLQEVGAQDANKLATDNYGYRVAAENIQQSLAASLQAKSSSNQYSIMSQVGENIINLVSLMFEFIQNNSSIPAVVSTVLMRLQIPYMRLALGDAKFFENQQHPARLLLNNLAELGFNVTTTDSKIYKIINGCVCELTDNFQTSKIQVLALEKKTRRLLQQLNNSNTKQEQAFEEQLRNETEQQEILEEANTAVAEFISKPIGQLKKPMIFHSLLEKVWSKVLRQTYMNYLPLSDERTEAIELFEKLLWSTGVGTTTLRKSDLIRALPGIVKGVDTAFNHCQMDELIRAHFLEQLQDIHLSFIKNSVGGKITVIDEPELQPSDTAQQAVAQLQQEQQAEEAAAQHQLEEQQREKASQAVGHDYREPTSEEDSGSPPSPGQPNKQQDTMETAPRQNAANDTIARPRMNMAEALDQLSRVRAGSRMDYMIKGRFTRCKVAFHSPSLEKYFFTDYQGVKLFERLRAELLVDIQDGYAKIISNSATFDQALEAVVSNIRQNRH